MKILKLLMKDQDVGTVIVAVIVTTNVQKTFCFPLMLSCSLEKILLARNLQHLWRKHQTFFFLLSHHYRCSSFYQAYFFLESNKLKWPRHFLLSPVKPHSNITYTIAKLFIRWGLGPKDILWMSTFDHMQKLKI